jgi:hypothetical protein
LTFLFLIVVVALTVGGFALVKARRASIRLERLSESYWELRYEHGQLASRVTRLETQDVAPGVGPGPEPAEPPSRQGMTFVPLSSLKR